MARCDMSRTSNGGERAIIIGKDTGKILVEYRGFFGGVCNNVAITWALNRYGLVALTKDRVGILIESCNIRFSND